MEPLKTSATDLDRGNPRGAVDRALDLLETLVAREGSAALADLALRSGLPKPTAHRMLQTFVARNYARQNEDGRYSPGSMLLTLSGQFSENLDFGDMAGPVMRALQNKLPETVHLALLEGDHAVYVAKVDGLRQMLMASRVGNRLALHCTSIGKAILAHLPAEERARLLVPESLVRRTAHTMTTVRDVEDELAAIRNQGYAIDNEENEEQIRCVGAAVFDRRGRVIGGLSLSSPAFAMPMTMAHILGPSVVSAARDLSISLGARPGGLPTTYAGSSDGLEIVAAASRGQ